MFAASEGNIALRVRELEMRYRTSRRPVFTNLSFDLAQGGRLAILGRNGQGKSTLIRLLGGIHRPTSGRIEWLATASWPIGFAGAFQGSLTGIDNIRFLSRLYSRDFKHMLDRVDDFAELGRSLRRPVKEYSAGMRARLAFGMSLAIEFDCYLIDELVAVGDARFQEKCQRELFSHRADRAFMMASHNVDLVREHCDRALLIEGGKSKMFEDIHEAIDIYSWLRAA